MNHQITTAGELVRGASDDRIPLAEAAKRMGVDKEDLRKAIKAGTAPFPAWAREPRAFGGKWSFTVPREGFENWMAGLTPPTAKEIAQELAKELAPHLPDLFFHCFDNAQKSG